MFDCSCSIKTKVANAVLADALLACDATPIDEAWIRKIGLCSTRSDGVWHVLFDTPRIVPDKNRIAIPASALPDRGSVRLAARAFGIPLKD